MSAPVYVIRAGKVRGQGKYLQSSVVGPPWGDAQSAARFDSREEAVDWIDLDPCSWSRVVALVPRKTVTHAHHTASVARARLAALDEAEQACLEERRRCNQQMCWGMASGARNCVAAIAALKLKENAK